MEGTVMSVNLHCTQKLRDRLKSAVAEPQVTDHWMGSWYATLLPWRPQMVLLVNEQTLLPVLVPLAPAATLMARIPGQVRLMLVALGAQTSALDEPLDSFKTAEICKTANRSLLGTMNEFCFLAEAYRGDNNVFDPLTIGLRLAETPCGGAGGYRYPVDLVKRIALL